MANDAPGYYMVRAKDQEKEDFSIFLENQVVAVGWSRIHFADFESVDDLVEAVEKEYYTSRDTAAQVIGKRKNEVRRFMRIKRGDRIIIPYWSNVLLAVAEAQKTFSPEAAGERDLGNQHLVSYVEDKDGELRTVPRDQLSEGLQRRLRVPGSAVSDLSDFAPEIEDLFGGESYVSTIARAQEEQMLKFKSDLLDVLQHGSSALPAGGLGLERLVEELLKADGYVAHSQSKARFAEFADADIEATRDDHVSPTKLLVQVKHHRGQSGTWGAEQLLHILDTESDLFSEYRLVLVTTGQPSEELETLCADRDVTLISGEDLVEWILDDLEALQPRTRSLLRISSAPQLISVTGG